MKKNTKMTREEFEQISTQKLQIAADQAKEIRKLLRQLEKDIADKKDKIQHYQDTFSDLQKQLIELLAISYSKGT